MLRQRSSAVKPERRADMGGRGRQVGVAERHQFRTRRGAGRMQQQRDVVGFRKPARRRCADRIALQPEHAGGSVAQRDEPDHPDAEPLGDGNRRAGFVLGDEDRLGADVGEVEIELVRAVGGIERRRRGGCRDRQKGRRHLRPVRQHDGHAVAAADAARVELAGRRPPSGGATRHGSGCSARAPLSPARRRHRRQSAR